MFSARRRVLVNLLGKINPAPSKVGTAGPQAPLLHGFSTLSCGSFPTLLRLPRVSIQSNRLAPRRSTKPLTKQLPSRTEHNLSNSCSNPVIPHFLRRLTPDSNRAGHKSIDFILHRRKQLLYRTFPTGGTSNRKTNPASSDNPIEKWSTQANHREGVICVVQV